MEQESVGDAAGQQSVGDCQDGRVESVLDGKQGKDGYIRVTVQPA
jgi:hypothetical protein